MKKKKKKVLLISASILIFILGIIGYNGYLEYKEDQIKEKTFSWNHKFTKNQVQEDLKYFKQVVINKFAYSDVNDVDINKEISKLEKLNKEKNGLNYLELQTGIEEIVNKYIDGHARVKKDPEDYYLEIINNKLSSSEYRYLPLNIDFIEDKFVATKSDRSDLLEPNYPYITEIQGKSINEWINLCSKFYPNGSPQRNKKKGFRELSSFNELMIKLGLDPVKEIAVVLESKQGEKITKTYKLSSNIPKEELKFIEQAKSKIIETDKQKIGYLRIAEMDVDLVKSEIKKWMPKFLDTDALVIDVRDNGGGKRKSYKEFLNYLVNEDEIKVINVARYKMTKDNLWNEDVQDALNGRMLYKKDNNYFTDKELKAIESFEKTFKPECDVNNNQFSDNYYMVISKRDKKIPTYKKPVYLLIDEYLFSATDIFASILKELDNVTLVGRPTGGGSSASRKFYLPNSIIPFKFGRMISYKADGELMDLHGVQPDEYIKVSPYYYTNNGEDEILNAVIDKINKSK